VRPPLHVTAAFGRSTSRPGGPSARGRCAGPIPGRPLIAAAR